MDTTSKDAKRKHREEVDQSNIMSEKRHRVLSLKVRENADTSKKGGTKTMQQGNTASGPDLAGDTNSEQETDESEMRSGLGSDLEGTTDDEGDEHLLQCVIRPVQPQRKSGSNAKGKTTATTKKVAKTPVESPVVPFAMAASQSLRSNDNDDDDVIIIDRPVSTKEKEFKIGDNPALLFFKKIKSDADSHSVAGDSHYECNHPHNGLSKIFKITRSMRGSVTGLIQHLEKHPDIYALYKHLKIVTITRLPTTGEVAIANGTLVPTREQLKEIIPDVPNTVTITDMFHRQDHGRIEPWDQVAFKQFLIEWLVVDDQPFTVVEQTHFQLLLRFVSRRASLTIPSADTMKRSVKEMKTDDFRKTKDMITKLDSKVALSLDAWSSSNGYAFLAIVMHFITNDWELDEKLIAFEEITGRHSGDNIGAIVWQTLERYGIKEKLIAINCDNASNNDTMLRYLETQMLAEGIAFSADQARMRCMPHTVHLAAMKLLEAIGATNSVTEESGSYQADMNPPDEDEEATREDGLDDSDDLSEVLTSLAKLRKLVRMIRSSPQRRQEWIAQVTTTLKENESSKEAISLMLILDVPTRWSSTHQMLRRALRFQLAIDSFCARREFRAYELDTKDWAAIELVAKWLLVFRRATTTMSATKTPALSSTYGYFLVLQDDLRKSIKDIPAYAPSQLKHGLIAAHQKLAEYLFRFNKSPYYLWASLLDPRISYSGMRRNAEGDMQLLQLIDDSKHALKDHFKAVYTLAEDNTSHPDRADDYETESTHDFTRLFLSDAPSTAGDELDEYFSMKQEKSWIDGEPVKWWAARRAQFPALSRFARDIHCIPGSAVAVERIFSGGRDTIALRRARLKPGTIGDLMMVKQALKRADRK